MNGRPRTGLSSNRGQLRAAPSGCEPLRAVATGCEKRRDRESIVSRLPHGATKEDCGVLLQIRVIFPHGAPASPTGTLNFPRGPQGHRELAVLTEQPSKIASVCLETE